MPRHIDLTRFIPTGMGNRFLTASMAVRLAVHPHRHGEQRRIYRQKAVVSGSSPQAWGTVHTRILINSDSRFIPTGMGNSSISPFNKASTTVHPHRHGEQASRLANRSSNCGSSPQAWGTVFRKKRAITDQRFIPTGMGNSIESQVENSGRTVHPHRHGEQSGARGSNADYIGSSPQAWGTVPSPFNIGK